MSLWTFASKLALQRTDWKPDDWMRSHKPNLTVGMRGWSRHVWCWVSSRVIYSRRIIRKIGDNHPVGPRTFSAREHEKHALQTPRAGAIILADMFEANMQLEYKKTWTSMPSNEALLLQQTQQRASFAGGTAIQALHSLSSRKAKPSAICTCLSFHAFGFFCAEHMEHVESWSLLWCPRAIQQQWAQKSDLAQCSKVYCRSVPKKLLAYPTVDGQKAVAPLTYPEKFCRLQPMRWHPGHLQCSSEEGEPGTNAQKPPRATSQHSASCGWIKSMPPHRHWSAPSLEKFALNMGMHWSRSCHVICWLLSRVAPPGWNHAWLPVKGER